MFFSDTFLSISRQAKKNFEQNFLRRTLTWMSKYHMCLLQPLTLIVSMDWRFEVILISAGCVNFITLKNCTFWSWDRVGRKNSFLIISRIWLPLLLRATKVVAWQPGSSFKQKLIFRTWHLRFRSQTLGYWGMEFSEIGIGSKRLLGQFYLTINTRQKYLTIFNFISTTWT